MPKRIKNAKALVEYVKRNVNFPQFLENEFGCTLAWHNPDHSAAVRCPMPHHKDEMPSFRLRYLEHDGVWVFNCFGCNSGGTIIDFFMDYYGISNVMEAVEKICDTFGFENDADVILAALKDVRKRVDVTKKMECEHIVTANQCRYLLKKDYERYSGWVAEQYRAMNAMLDESDLAGIEQVGSKASRKIGEK